MFGPDLRGHVPALDGVRGLAILTVMLYHMTLIDGANAFDRGVLGVIKAGWLGVDIFFVLSGFLITGLLYDAKGSAHYFRNFYARRTVRIFPLYYAVVALCLIVLPRIPHPKAASFGRIAGDEIWYWLYLSNFSISNANGWRHAILDISWSLAIEEQFYLLWPAIVFACTRRTLLKVCAGMIVAAILTRAAIASTGAHWIHNYVLTPARMDGLAVGAAIALFARGEGGLVGLVPAARRAAPVLGALLLGLFAVSGHSAIERPLFQVVGFTTLELFLGSLFVLGLTASPTDTWVGRRLGGRFLRTLGKYSYALYLFHLPLRALVRDTVYGAPQFPVIAGSLLPAQIAFYAAAGLVTFAAAFLSWHLFEKHFLKLKSYFPSSPGGAAAKERDERRAVPA